LKESLKCDDTEAAAGLQTRGPRRLRLVPGNKRSRCWGGIFSACDYRLLVFFFFAATFFFALGFDFLAFDFVAFFFIMGGFV